MRKKNPAAGKTANGARRAHFGSEPRQYSIGRSFSKPGFPFSPDTLTDLAIRLFGEPNRQQSTRTELRWRRKGSLALRLDSRLWFDHEAGVGGGVLDFIVHAGVARTRAEAARLLERHGDDRQFEPTRKKHCQRAADELGSAAKHRAALSLWNAAQPIKGSPAERYLQIARGIHAPLGEAHLRFHPAAPYFPYRPDARHLPALPALLAAVRNRCGDVTGLHLTYLRSDGLGKARLTPSRKMIGAVRGGHVRLIPGDCIVVAEGIESAVSAWQAVTDGDFDGGDNLGAVAVLSAGGMARFEWPPRTVALIIAPDRDENAAGLKAASELARRASAAGLGVSFLFPPDGCSDWNDAVRQDGAS